MLSVIVILLSTVVICLIFFLASKKVRRKDKKKKVKTITILILILIFMCYGLIRSYNKQQENNPDKVDMLESLSLNMTKKDVALIKGMPSILYDNYGSSVNIINEKNTDDDNLPIWVYQLDRQSLTVTYQNNRIYSIRKSSHGKAYERCFNRTYIGQDSGELIQFLGKPSAVSTTSTGLNTVYSYKAYNLFYELTNNKIVACGIYNSNTSTREYTPDKKPGFN